MKFSTSLAVLLLTGNSLFAVEEPLDTFIEGKLKEYQVPGAVVVIVEDGKAPYVKGFGVTDIETGQKVNENTRFQLASVTKTFTGALFGAAVDHTEMEFDQPVQEVFPHFRLHDAYATRWATEEDLLSHRSGLPRLEGGLLEFLGFTKEEILKKIPEIKPSTSFRNRAGYSNIGYFLAGEATARAAGLPWMTLLKTRILDPLQMKDTGLAADIMTSSQNVAKPYVKTFEGQIVPTTPNYQPTLIPAGALASTGNDMAKYLQMWLSKGQGPGNKAPVLSPKSVEKLFTPIIAEEPGFAEMAPISKKTGFNFTAGGWGVFHYQNQRVFEKGGALEGYRTVVVLVPDKKWGVAILSNLNVTVFPEAVRAELLERTLGRSDEDFQAMIHEKSNEINEMFAPPERPEDATPPPLELSAYMGTYSNEHYGQWQVLEKDGQLIIEAGPAKFRGSLTPWTDNDFLLTWPLANAGMSILPFKVTGKKVTGFTYDNNFEFRRMGDK